MALMAGTPAGRPARPSGMRRSRATSTSSGPIIVTDVMMPVTIAVVSASVPRLTSCSSPGALTGARLAAVAGVGDQQGQTAGRAVVLEVVAEALEAWRRWKDGEHRHLVGGQRTALVVVRLEHAADHAERGHVGRHLGAGQRRLLLDRLHRAGGRLEIRVEQGAGCGHDDERDEDL